MSHEEKEIQNIENEIAPLRTEVHKLSQDSFLLHAEIRATKFHPKQKELQGKAHTLDTKIKHLQSEINTLTEKQAIPKLIHMLKENRQIIKLSINNNNRVEIPENLEITLTFEGCNHTRKMPVYELLRYQTTLDTNTKLLTQWEINIREGYTTQRNIHCEQCIEEKKTLLAKFHIIKPSKHTGIARVKIVIFV